MADIAMVVDLDSCCGCFACQAACKMVNDLPDGVQWLKVMPEYCQPEEYNGQMYMDRFPVPLTLHACENCPDRAEGKSPLCASTCMGRALFVGSKAEADSWAEGRRTVMYKL